MKHPFTLLITLLLSPLAVLEATAPPTGKPNVIFILTDKALGWAKSLPASPLRDAAEKTGHTQDDNKIPKPAKAKDAADGTNSNENK